MENNIESLGHEDYMNVWGARHNELIALAELHYPLITKYWAIATGNVIDSPLSPRELVERYPMDRSSFPLDDDGKINIDNWDRSSALTFALVLEQQAMILPEMMGADDSWGDYIPNGARTYPLLLDTYDGYHFLNYVLNPNTEDELADKYGIWFQDCAGALLMSIVQTEDDDLYD